MMKVTLTQPSPNQVTASGSQAIPDKALKKPAIGSTTGESLRRSPTKIPSPTASGTLITRETTTRLKLAATLLQSDPSLSIAHAVLATSPGGGRKIAGRRPDLVATPQAITISIKGSIPRPRSRTPLRQPRIIVAPYPTARSSLPPAGGEGNNLRLPIGRR